MQSMCGACIEQNAGTLQPHAHGCQAMSNRFPFQYAPDEPDRPDIKAN
jgi:hypothetical protein